MTGGYQIRAAKALRMYCPMEPNLLATLLAGDASALEQDPTISRILSVIRREEVLGDFGAYRSVIELACGWELFTPGVTARPTLGKAGATSMSPTAILTLYVPDEAPVGALDRAVEAIMKAHPWEVPVIEICATHLVARPDIAEFRPT